ncbi:MAG: Death-on-curing family protein [Candidatus Daviesbacteria bacterium GW2011_GWA2_42_7]|uniref:Death-on-curing family protein n=2 Tax=Candidatus Daviesiibacteriota TaxID=1752718 RepID=A0A0G1E8W9_9BACT|nr:MAG: Death-on-curing family protein [Candidatus Daviesbacteria bacterium GW2011_GWA2_42_7]
MKFLSLEEVLAIHDRMLEVGGGREGIHDFSLLHSAVERPKAQFGGKYLYSSIWLMAAAMLHSLVKNHSFEDGNKRTAYFSTMRFLRKNGHLLKVGEKDIIKFVVNIDVGNTPLEEIASWLKKNSKEI